MEKIINKIFNCTIDIFSLVSSAIIVWLILSVLQVNFCDPQYNKKSNFNIFILSESNRMNNQSETDIIVDDIDEEDEPIISC